MASTEFNISDPVPRSMKYLVKYSIRHYDSYHALAISYIVLVRRIQCHVIASTIVDVYIG